MPLYLLALSVLFFAFACENDDEALQEATLKEVALMIQNEIGEAPASALESCSMMPIGVKPAGGPWGYIIFSNDYSNKEKLEKLIERYNELDAERNEGENGFSTSDFATEPDLILENGSCRGVGVYAWNPGTIMEQAGFSEE